jgi:hypothetical protein
MRTQASTTERPPGLNLEVCDEEGRVVDHVTVRDLSAGIADDSSSRRHPSHRRSRTGH